MLLFSYYVLYVAPKSSKSFIVLTVDEYMDMPTTKYCFSVIVASNGNAHFPAVVEIWHDTLMAVWPS